MWLVYTLLVTFFAGFINVFEKKYSKDQPKRYIISAIFLFFILNLIASIILEPSVLSNFNFYYCLKVIPYSIAIILSYYTSVKALSNGDVSRVTPIKKSFVVLVLIISTVFLNEKLAWFQVLLIFTILLLNILLAKEKYDKRRKNNYKSILYSFLYVICAATTSVLMKVYIMDGMDPLEISFYTGISSIVLIIALLFITNKADYLNFKKFKNFKMVIVVELLETISAILNRYSLITGNLSIVTSITTCSIIITLLLSKIVFKEKISSRKWFIIFLMILSLILLSISS